MFSSRSAALQGCSSLAVVLVASAQAYAQPTLRITRVSEPPKLEEFLDGTPPAGAVPITGFRQREPNDGEPVSQRTEAYVSYDDHNLYAVFVCHDSEPAKVRARLTKREDFFGDDIVAIVLDTFHDRRRAYEFLVNPYGIQLDGITAEGQEDDFSFDTLWKSEGRLTPFGFVVRIAIPFRSLRFPSTETQTWGIALVRGVARENETSFWPYITRRVAGFAQQMATLEGLEKISPGRNIQLIPYGAFAGARFPGNSPGRYDTDADGRAGLDGKFVLKDAFTLDVALNPDFSQVESDEPQVTINQRFEVFFPERRPFFIENATYFEMPINLVFSRRIADPQFGARFTGKRRGWALGALVIDDRAPGRRLAPGSPGFGDRTGVMILRAQRDIGEQSAVGFLVTNRDVGPFASRVASADGRIKLNDNWFAQGQAVFTSGSGLELSVSAPGRDETDNSRPDPHGGALQASVNRSSRTFNYSAEYLDVSPDFRAPLGFVRRVDMRQLEQGISYSWWPGGRVRRFGPDLRAWAIWDHDGTLHDWFVSPDFGIEFAGRTEVEFDHRQSMERFEGIEFRKHTTSIDVQTEYLSWLSASAELELGTEINFFPGSGIAPFLANANEASVGVTLRPLSQLRVEQRYLHSSLSVRDPIAERPVERPGSSIFANHIFRTRVNYQFTRELSLRAIVDYSTVSANAALVDLSHARDLTADVLVTYLLNPGTAVYVGYTDRYESDPFEAFTGPFARRDPRLRSSGRQIFVKASYLFRF